MKYTTLTLGILLSGPLIAQEVMPAQQQLLASNNPNVYFRENKGQVKDQHWQPRPDVLYSGETGGLVYHLKKDGLHYQLNRVETWWEPEHDEYPLRGELVSDEWATYRVDVNWLNTNPEAQIETGRELPGYENFYNVPEGVESALFVKKYAGIIYRDLYPGIDLHFFESLEGALEYDFMVQPGADYRQIQMEIEGAELCVNAQNKLVIETPFGVIREGALQVYQEGEMLEAHWQVQGNRVSFDIPEHNPAYALRIDPPVRIWGTYYGGSDGDYGAACATNGNGDVFLAGRTYSTSDIATIGAHQNAYGGGGFDAFIVKFDNDGGRQWATYYGGNGEDLGESCAVDGNGNVFLAGFTASANAVATIGAHQENHGGGVNDAFLVKLDDNGLRQWGTYYGGSSDDGSYACATDGSGNVFLAGETESTDSIATGDAHQAIQGGLSDAFLVKFNDSGVRQWGTYYGGGDDDYGYACTVDGSGNVFLAGETQSSEDIATVGAHQESLSDLIDAFLVKFDGSGTRQWGTYYGGNDQDRGRACVTNDEGHVFLTGFTDSDTLIATTGAHQETHGGFMDAFLVKFDNSGVRQWGTYYGGEDWDETYSGAVDSIGNIFLAGRTKSTTAIASSGTYQETFGGNRDAFLVMFDGSGERQWGTYYGGGDYDDGNACALDGNGIVFLMGTTGSSEAIGTSGAYQGSYGGGLRDAYMVKFDTSSTTGVEGVTSSITPFYLYPNPNSGSFTITWDEPVSSAQITITNVAGQVVYQDHITGARSDHEITLQVPQGVFFVRVQLDKVTYVERVVVTE